MSTLCGLALGSSLLPIAALVLVEVLLAYLRLVDWCALTPARLEGRLLHCQSLHICIILSAETLVLLCSLHMQEMLYNDVSSLLYGLYLTETTTGGGADPFSAIYFAACQHTTLRMLFLLALSSARPCMQTCRLIGMQACQEGPPKRGPDSCKRCTKT